MSAPSHVCFLADLQEGDCFSLPNQASSYGPEFKVVSTYVEKNGPFWKRKEAKILVIRDRRGAVRHHQLDISALLVVVRFFSDLTPLTIDELLS